MLHGGGGPAQGYDASMKGSLPLERSFRAKRAFTLSELLAVIAILGALFALLLPAFVSAKDESRRSVCASNLHQIGVATNLYMADWESAYPKLVNWFERKDPSVIRLGRGKDDDPRAYPSPSEALGSYVRGDRAFRCPMDLGSQIATFDLVPTLYEDNGKSSYLFAELFDGQTENSWSDPAKATWACDGSPSWHSPDYDENVPSTYRSMSLFYDWHVAPKATNSPTYLE